MIFLKKEKGHYNTTECYENACPVLRVVEAPGVEVAGSKEASQELTGRGKAGIPKLYRHRNVLTSPHMQRGVSSLTRPGLGR